MINSFECADMNSASQASSAQTSLGGELPPHSQATLELDLDGTIRAAKSSFCRLLGYSPSEMIGRHHGDFISANEAEAPRYAEFWRLIGAGETAGMDYGFQARDGREIRLTALYGPKVDVSGQVIGFAIYALNVPQTLDDEKAQFIEHLNSTVRPTLQAVIASLNGHLETLQRIATSQQHPVSDEKKPRARDRLAANDK